MGIAAIAAKRVRPGKAAETEVAVDVIVEADAWRGLRGYRTAIRHAVAAAAEGAGKVMAAPAEVAVTLTDDAHIRALNARYRDKDAPTNVLSFPAPKSGKLFGPLLGDIVLAFETVEREAGDEEVAISAHLTHLVVHGFLHLLGYDHISDREAVEMEGLETAILRGMGIADPYAERQESRGDLR